MISIARRARRWCGDGAEEEKKDGEAANGGTVFQFSKISFLVKDKKAETGTKKILDDISATVCSGRVLAIMGPSGAGKTTLINALTLQGFGGTTTGSVTLDGAPMSPSSSARAASSCRSRTSTGRSSRAARR